MYITYVVPIVISIVISWYFHDCRVLLHVTFIFILRIKLRNSKDGVVVLPLQMATRMRCLPYRIVRRSYHQWIRPENLRSGLQVSYNIKDFANSAYLMLISYACYLINGDFDQTDQITWTDDIIDIGYEETLNLKFYLQFFECFLCIILYIVECVGFHTSVKRIVGVDFSSHQGSVTVSQFVFCQ